MLDKEGRICRSQCHVRERAETLAQGGMVYSSTRERWVRSSHGWCSGSLPIARRSTLPTDLFQRNSCAWIRREWSGCNFITGFLRIDFIDQCQDFLVTGDGAHAVTIIDKAHHCNAEMYCNDKFVELESLGPHTKLGPGFHISHLELWDVIEGLDSLPRAMQKSISPW